MGKFETKLSVRDVAERENAAHKHFKKQYLEIANTRNWLNDYFVTLTFKDNYKKDEVQASLDGYRYLRMLDRAMLGRLARKEGRKLYRYVVFELNKSAGLHMHLLIENPGDIYINQLCHFDTIVDTWLKLDCSGKKVGNNVQKITETPELVVDYLHKHISAKNSLMADPNLWHLP